MTISGESIFKALTVIGLAVGSFALGWMFVSNRDIGVMEQQLTTLTTSINELKASIKESHDDIISDDRRVVELEKTKKQHWQRIARLLTKLNETRFRVNTLSTDTDLDTVDWDGLD